MKRPLLALVFLLAACTPEPKMESPAATPAVYAGSVAANPTDNSAALASVERDLKTLDYNTGKSPDDPGFARAIIAFERDQGLGEDGQITPQLLDRLSILRALLAKTPERRAALYIYSDGVTRQESLGFLMPPPKGLLSDTQANFLMPLRPGNEATYHLGTRAKGKITPGITVTCHVGRLTSADTVLGQKEIMPVDCAGRGAPNAPSWRAFFSPELNAVTRLENGSRSVALVALRPATSGWPAAARTGLEWALTHQLDAPASAAPAQWSSTGVAAHFEIRATSQISGQQAGLSGKFAALSCRRFEIMGGGARYPGLACRDNSSWIIPGSSAALASPASALIGGKVVMREKTR